MKCVSIEQLGSPSEVVSLAERPTPVPGPGQVRVRMLLSPVHNHDLVIVRGSYGFKPELPAVPGTESAGVIDALGEGVDGLQVGQRVAAVLSGGAWAEYFLAPADSVVPLPDGLPDEAACQLLAMPLSAFMLLEDLQLQPGQWLVQNAANGAVGKAVATLAYARGLNVVSLVRRDAALDDLRAAGIPNGVSTEAADWYKQVAAITGGAPIVRAVDSVGGEATEQLLRLLADAGELVSFGYLTFQPLSIRAEHLIFKQITVKGWWASKRLGEVSAEELGRMIGAVAGAVADGSLKLPVDQIFELGQAPDAMNAASRAARSGKVLLRGTR